jgi:hypothetical protein
MPVVSNADHATHLIAAAAELGNHLSFADAAAGLSAAAQLKAQGLGGLKLRDLSTLTADQRQLLRDLCRVGARSSGDGQKRRWCEQFLRELSRITLENLNASWGPHGHNSGPPTLSEREWIEANGY